jgi:hypothetical protein
MNSKINELRALIRKEIVLALREEDSVDKLKAQITNTETDIEKKSKSERDKLANLYNQLSQQLKK